MSNVHQSFTTGLDSKPYEAGLARMENATKTSTARTAREFDKIQTSANRQSRSMGGGGAMRAGQLSMQMQDVFVQLQGGTAAATVLAQQGSQIASIFGPGGMVVGGLIAVSALLWSSANAGKEIAENSKKEALERKKIESSRAHEKGLKDIQSDVRAAELAKVRAEQGEKAASALEREYRIQDRLNDLREERDKGLISEGSANLKAGLFMNRMEAEQRAEFKKETRDRGAQRVSEEGQKVLDRAAQIRGQSPSKAEARREERAQIRAERRAREERIDEIDRAERNKLQGTGKSRTTGLTADERARADAARKAAVEVAKNEKLKAEISQDNIDKILNGIDNLIAR